MTKVEGRKKSLAILTLVSLSFFTALSGEAQSKAKTDYDVAASASSCTRRCEYFYLLDSMVCNLRYPDLDNFTDVENHYDACLQAARDLRTLCLMNCGVAPEPMAQHPSPVDR